MAERAITNAVFETRPSWSPRMHTRLLNLGRSKLWRLGHATVFPLELAGVQTQAKRLETGRYKRHAEGPAHIAHMHPWRLETSARYPVRGALLFPSEHATTTRSRIRGRSHARTTIARRSRSRPFSASSTGAASRSTKCIGEGTRRRQRRLRPGQLGIPGMPYLACSRLREVTRWRRSATCTGAGLAVKAGRCTEELGAQELGNALESGCRAVMRWAVCCSH